jgi:hypothetical protein
MRLENPARTRSRNIAPADINQRMASAMAQTRIDITLVDSLRRILESPNPQAETLRNLIRRVVNG